MVIVFRATDTIESVKRYGICDGQGRVDKDTCLWFGGIGGKLKEGLI